MPPVKQRRIVDYVKEKSKEKQKTETETQPDPHLSSEQRRAIELALAGTSFFLTGSAGVGKSYVLRHMIHRLRDLHGSQKVYVTASTGAAAFALGGTTLHSFAGVGLGNGTVQDLLLNMPKHKRQNWVRCAVLIIDEVSMVPGGLLDKLNALAQSIRDSDAPFGGIQLIACGDYFQLPPVVIPGEAREGPLFAFQSSAWKAAIGGSVVELTQPFRQATDAQFVHLLNEIRWGRVPDNMDTLLDACYDTTLTDDFTHLYPLKNAVEGVNVQRLRNLPGDDHTYNAVDSGRQKEGLKNCPVGPQVTLRLGAQVILVKNITSRLVNGSRGVVTDFGADGYPVVSFFSGDTLPMPPQEFKLEQNGAVMATRVQVPLALAWALSVHKAQGMSIDRVHLDMCRVFEHGQAYVALSRVRSLAGLHLAPFSYSVIKAHPDVVAYYKQLKENHEKQLKEKP